MVAVLHVDPETLTCELGAVGDPLTDLFTVDLGWADDRGETWRAVTNNPGLQARREGDVLYLRGTVEGTWTLHAAALGDQTVYVAERVD